MSEPSHPRYRIRWARVEVCNGYTCWRDWRCMAEALVMLPLGLSFWWPLRDAHWRTSERQAQGDIDHDIRLRLPPEGASLTAPAS